MQKTRLVVENMKCGGCENTITKALTNLGLKNVNVNSESGSVEFDTAEANKIDEVVGKLRSLGYPLVETEEGLKALALKAKSYISCAIGKVS